MTALEQKVYEKLIETMDLEEGELQGFDENSPIFAENTEEGQPSMNLDSIDALELVVMIEKEWGLKEIPAEEMMKMRTVKAIADYIEANGGEA